MRLTKVHVTNFRSVEDSNEFEITDVTCLVGKNESGKTTILQAIERLNPINASKKKYEKLRDYPRRHWSDYTERHDGKEARVLTTEWVLEPEDIAAVEAMYGKGALKSKTLTIAKGYESEFGSWDFAVDEQKAVQQLALEAGVADEAKALQKLADLLAFLKGKEAQSENVKKVIQKVQGIREGRLILGIIDVLHERLPKFLYFSEYSRMNGEVSVDKLKQDTDQKKVAEGDDLFLKFLQYAGTELKDLQDSKKFEELRAKLEAASNKITERVFEYWTQNQFLRVNVSLDQARPNDPPPFNSGNVVRALVWNDLHKASVSFNDRSSGFVWFFSFLVAFVHVTKQYGNVIILLDEPGHGLHGKAQADLLRFIDEKLKPKHQVIYTTHSPFMVPATKLESVRIVEDVLEFKGGPRPVVHGTKVSSEFLSTDSDTVFPLQAALGFEVTQTLFVGANTLLVEGPADILYLQAASTVLNKRKRVGLDDRWTVCPSGGVDKIYPFVSLFVGNKINIAVLTDFASGIKKNVERLRNSNLIASERVMLVTDFVGKPEGDIEDFFAPTLWASIVNSAYELKPKNHLKLEHLMPNGNVSLRCMPVTEAHFKVLPDTIPMLDHFTPAEWLLRNTAILEVDSPEVLETLDRFERAFQRINSFIK